MVANGTDGGVAADLVLHAEVRLIRGRPVAPSGPERLVDLRIRNGSTEVRVTGRAEHVARLQSEVWIEDQEVAVVGPSAIPVASTYRPIDPFSAVRPVPNRS